MGVGAVVSTQVSSGRGILFYITVAVCLCLYFLPSALAVLRGNMYRGQVIKYQILVMVIEVIVSTVGGIINILGIKAIIIGIGLSAFGLVMFALWMYILYHSIKDREMTLLSRFGINI